jgi:hypothetical protein
MSRHVKGGSWIPSLDNLGMAHCFAVMAHAGQTDKSGHPYIEHALRVSANCSWHSVEAMIVGALHDVVEDTKWEVGHIEAKFGRRIATAVDAITHREGESRDDYMLRVKRNGLARAAKISDLRDNLSPDRWIDDERHERRTALYRIDLRSLLGIDGWMMEDHWLDFFELVFQEQTA